MARAVGPRRPAPAQQGPDAGGQLLGLERLGDVVVGAGLEPRHHVEAVGPGGDHDDGDVAVLAQRTAHLEPVLPGASGRAAPVGRASVERAEALLAVGGLAHVVALVLQHLPGRLSDRVVVLYEQDFVATIHRRPRGTSSNRKETESRSWSGQLILSRGGHPKA